jgi:hypothetical protein
VTVTVPGALGSVSVTPATPELFVGAIIMVAAAPLFASDPALVVKKTGAPVAVPPEAPGARVTERLSVVPTLPVC